MWLLPLETTFNQKNFAFIQSFKHRNQIKDHN